MAITDILKVKDTGRFTNEFSDSEILTEIDIVEADLYQRYHLPKRSKFSVDNDYTTFYFSENKVHEIVRLQISVDTSVDPSGYLTIEPSSTTWSHLRPNNYITLDSSFISTYDSKTIRIQYIPLVYNTMASIITALNLIDTSTIVDGQEQVPPLVGRLKGRLERIKNLVKPKVLLNSSRYSNYDKYDYISYTQSYFR